MSQIKGILGEKLGMTQIFEETRAVPVTVIKAGPCFVAQVKTKEADGYDAVQLAFAEAAPNKPMQGHFDAHGGQPGRHLVELRTDDASSYTPGQELRADVFAAGERADVVGVSRGKGFSGVMRRHGFSGLGASHGTEKKHRSPGLDRRVRHALAGLQGDADGRPAREPAHHGVEPRGRPGRPRTQPAPGQGRRPRSERRARHGPVRRQGSGDGREGRLMASIELRDAQGKKVGSRDLPADVFESTVSVPLMHQVVTAGLAGIRAGTHSTKTRGDVSGGGKKPWRQKGTGRARQGSIRSPQWVGGGVAHGPHPHSHEMRVNKKMRRGALRSALTDALQSGKLAAVNDIAFDEPKTRDAVDLLNALELDGKVLVVLPEPQEVVEKSFRNLRHVRITYAKSLGTYEILRADRVLFTDAAIGVLEGSAGVAQ